MKEKVIRTARELGLDVGVKSLGATRRSAAEVAAALGCSAPQIARAVVYVADGEPVLVVASSAGDVDLGRVCDALDCAEARRASAAEVRAATGYPIDGVSPIGAGLPVLFDEALLAHAPIYVAAGDGATMVEVGSRELAACVGARVVALTNATQRV